MRFDYIYLEHSESAGWNSNHTFIILDCNCKHTFKWLKVQFFQNPDL